jgi:flagellar biosynthesis protein
MRRKHNQPPPAAVALRYDGRAAPQVTAKGKGEIAERILEIARAHDVPVSEDPQLVQLLSAIDLGHEIPSELYVAVAQVLAFAYRLSGSLPPEPESGP